MNTAARLAAAAAFVLLSAGYGEADEIQVPLDREGKLTVIDAGLERKLELFQEVQRFRAARLYQVTDTTYVLEIEYSTQGQTARSRRELDAAECEAFRRRVTAAIIERAPEATCNHEGRAKWLGGTLSLSLGYWGWALPVVAHAKNEGAVAMYMLTGASGFLIPYLLTNQSDVTDGDAALSLYGGTRGIAHGIAFAYLVSGEEADEDDVIGSGMAFSLAELIAGYAISSSSEMTDGQAATIGVLGDFGLGIGLGTAHVAGLLEEDEDVNGAAGLTLIGSGVGLGIGALLAGDRTYSRGDAAVLRAAGYAGAAIPVTIADLAQAEDAETYSAAAMAGAVIGLVTGNRVVRGKDFSTTQGRLVTLSEFAGALMGLGFAYVVDPGVDRSEVYTGLTTTGALLGFGLMVNYQSRQAAPEEERFSWDLRVQPAGLAGMVVDRDLPSGAVPPAVSAIIHW